LAKRQSLPPHPVQFGKHQKVIPLHQVVIVQLRASAIRMEASPGSTVASWPCQVGAAEQGRCRDQEFHAAILSIKNATRICETSVLAKASTPP
jgi:hypothetical protein